MKTSKMSEVIQHLRRVVLLQDGAGLTDSQLLECFINCREEAALAALVHRHGPMVWAVCRRVLSNHHDAEDAFQATFLVLLRKAASIQPRDLVANWLYGVAHQTALKANHLAAKRRARERQVIDMPEPKGVDQDRSHGLQFLLDEELSRLPDKYRAVIVLCDLQGKTRKEAARELGVPEGTVASRMATARTKLAKRLARHGLALGGGSLAAALSPNLASASVPATVMSSTIKAVTSVAAGKAATGLISANVAALTEGVVKAMLLTKLKAMGALLVLLSMVTLTSVMVLAWGQTKDWGPSVEKPVAQGKGTARPKGAENATGRANAPAAKQGNSDNAKPGNQSNKANQPTELPEELVVAWMKAGARVGWMAVDLSQPLYDPSWEAAFVTSPPLIGFSEGFKFREGGMGRNGEVPAFQFNTWKAGVLAKLPQPQTAFGLDFNFAKITDAGLKEMAELKNLQTLNLGKPTAVTDAGLKELARLKSLQSLTLGGDSKQITGAGLKELTGLNNLNLLVLKLTDADVKGLAELQGLQSLGIGDLKAQITGAGLHELAGLKSLQTLMIGCTKLTEADLKELAGLKKLQYIQLGGAKITDAGLKHLAGMENLHDLQISMTEVTDEGLKELTGLKELQTLDLRLTKVKDAGLKHLAGLKQLRSLNLNNTSLTDTGLKELGKLTSLQSLELANIEGATDTGLRELTGLKNLRLLELRGTGVTKTGVAELQKALPRLRIEFDHRD